MHRFSAAWDSKRKLELVTGWRRGWLVEMNNVTAAVGIGSQCPPSLSVFTRESPAMSMRITVYNRSGRQYVVCLRLHLDRGDVRANAGSRRSVADGRRTCAQSTLEHASTRASFLPRQSPRLARLADSGTCIESTRNLARDSLHETPFARIGLISRARHES